MGIPNKITTVKQIIENQEAIKKVGDNVIAKQLCKFCYNKMLRANLLRVPIWKVFSLEYHRQIDRTLCRKCKANIKKTMLNQKNNE